MIQLAHVLIVDIASIDADRCSLDVSIIEDVPCKVKWIITCTTERNIIGCCDISLTWVGNANSQPASRNISLRVLWIDVDGFVKGCSILATDGVVGVGGIENW